VGYKNKIKGKFYYFKRSHCGKEFRDCRGFYVVFKITFEEFEDKYKKTKGFCKVCDHQFNNLTVDVNPPISRVKKGHVYIINDIQFLCRRCNSAKNNRTDSIVSYSISCGEMIFAWMIPNSLWFPFNNLIYRWSPCYRFMNGKGGWYQKPDTKFSPYYVPSRKTSVKKT